MDSVLRRAYSLGRHLWNRGLREYDPDLRSTALRAENLALRNRGVASVAGCFHFHQSTAGRVVRQGTRRKVGKF